jgi:hypothetical protein
MNSALLPILTLSIVFATECVAQISVPSEFTRLIQQAGNTDDETDRQKFVESLAALADLTDTQRTEAKAMADFVRRWNTGGLKFYNAPVKGKPARALGSYDFGIATDSPLRPIAELYRGRMLAWTLIENSNVRTNPVEARWFKDEAIKSFQTVEKAFPQNRIAGMYQGRAIPWPKQFAAVEGAPEWATLQREQLERLRDVILWWIDHRQKPDGQFGGGWGDDCEMWRWWSSVLLGFDDPKITAAQLKFSKNAVTRPHLKGGFNTAVSDVEHAAEDTTDNLVPLMVLEPDEKRWQDWALRLGDFMENVWTARNERHQIQFKSFYFSATETAPEPARAFDVIPDVGALHPALLAWQRTGDAQLGNRLCGWLDTWVDATARAEGGKPAGILPASIRWPDGAVAGAEDKWWQPIKPGGYMHSYYIWPSVITEMTDALVVAYLSTNNERYLAPIRSMAAIRLRHLQNPPAQPGAPGSESWCAAELAPRRNANSNTGGLVKTVARLKALTGTTEFDELLRLEGSEFVIRTDKTGRQELTVALRESADAMRTNFPGFTSEVRSTDRVMRFAQFLSHDYEFDAYKGVNIPKHELLYRMVSGDKNSPRFPQMAVRWLTEPTNIAALVTEASTTRLEAELFHFGQAPRPISAQFYLLKPGKYEAKLIIDGQSQSLPPLTIERNKLATAQLTLPAQKQCVLQVALAH